MFVPVSKRYEYWNHFIARWAVHKEGGGSGVTGKKLSLIETKIIADDDFWQDVVLRHGGMDINPEALRSLDEFQYNHCQGNFWGMVYQTLVIQRLVGP